MPDNSAEIKRLEEYVCYLKNSIAIVRHRLQSDLSHALSLEKKLSEANEEINVIKSQ